VDDFGLVHFNLVFSAKPQPVRVLMSLSSNSGARSSGLPVTLPPKLPLSGQGGGGGPSGAGKPHAGKYREVTLLRLLGGRCSPSPLPTGDWRNKRKNHCAFISNVL